MWILKDIFKIVIVIFKSRQSQYHIWYRNLTNFYTIFLCWLSVEKSAIFWFHHFTNAHPFYIPEAAIFGTKVDR